jgi:aryl-alcohol dehydrogenase-like predicted oxidoreductase
MPRARLGTNGPEVSALGLGAMELRGALHHRPRPLPPGQAERLLNRALDSGIDLVDTALEYGESEETIGRALSGRRDEFFLASKCGCPVVPPSPDQPHGRGSHDYSPETVVAGVHESLRRLRTDHLDLVQLHASPSRSVLEREGTVEALVQLRDEGKVRMIGSSSVLPHLRDLLDMDVFDVVQVPYSALQREHEEVLHQAAAHGVGVIVRGVVAQAGHETPAAAGGWADWDAAGLDELLDGMTRPQFLLRFALGHPAVGSALIGTADEGHLAQAVDAAGRGPLPDDVRQEVVRRLDAV